jgi:hypothetical protein
MRKSLLKLPEKIVRKQFIENESMNLCINCFYFVNKNKIRGETESQPESQSENKNYNYQFDAICLKYAKKDLINGNIIYIPAKLARYNENKCGIEAKYFEEK